MLNAATVARAEVEDFLFHEAALLDAWKLDEWLTLLTDDATYRVPSNDAPDARVGEALFIIADDAGRIRERVHRLKDRNAHAEFPHSRTRRIVSNVRIVSRTENEISAEANFVVYRHRRDENIRVYVGQYRHVLRVTENGLRIAERNAILDAFELGSMGLVSFML